MVLTIEQEHVARSLRQRLDRALDQRRQLVRLDPLRREWRDDREGGIRVGRTAAPKDPLHFAMAKLTQRAVSRGAVQIRLERTRHLPLLAVLPYPEEEVVHDVARVLTRPQQPARVRRERFDERAKHDLERLVVTSADGGDGVAIRGAGE